MAKTTIDGPPITVRGPQQRHGIVRTVVNTFIDTEHAKKGRGVRFRYAVETLSDGSDLYIVRPGHKKNFDFKVDVQESLGVGRGKHGQIVEYFRNKLAQEAEKAPTLLEALKQVWECSECDVDLVLASYPSLQLKPPLGPHIGDVLKVLKWMFIMEDILYWDYSGREMLYRGLLGKGPTDAL